ncbi:GAF domain-containing DNA-binding protein (plasmid) [Ensifer adhaerens]|uniref:GAF domain-containing DNA-binding protein n=1 Tax=Ensifer adhaerens TaxID=106592 RepID=UPI0023A9289A|nr:GAF domain-containing DNA-binding protein [Ensifer adhaerens]WDZ80493.1 GAF domain-containing DNA-binding protein [Ensifer adhaerens]
MNEQSHPSDHSITFPPYELIATIVPPCTAAGRPAQDWAYLAATHLIGSPAKAAIAAILEETGMLAGADRAWMFEYCDDLLRFRNTEEWVRGDVSSHVADLQQTPVTMIGWLHQWLVAGKAVMINDVARLPRPARALQAEMLRQNDKSVLCVPVFHEGALRACIGFDATRAVRRWPIEEIHQLARCAKLIGIARYGRTSTYGEREGAAAITSAGTDQLVHLHMPGRTRGVPLSAIVGLRSAKDYTQIWLKDEAAVLDLRPLSFWTGLLPKSNFLRIHRTAVINLSHVTELDRHSGPTKQAWAVRLRRIDESWAVSRPYRQELRSRLGI